MGDPENTEMRPRYRWRETWPGEGHQDFVGCDGDRQFGRIFYEPAGPTKDTWRWAISHIEGVRRMILPHNGWEPTPRAAARKVEDLYHALAALNRLQPEPSHSAGRASPGGVDSLSSID